jgi:carboxymethylenebutenolidase
VNVNQGGFDMAGKWIDIATEGGKFEGYLALPPAGKGPGIVLIQEIFGVNPHIRGVADQYALDGYVVLAPDLYWRVKPHIELGYEGTMQEGFGYLQQIGVPTLVKDLVASAKALRSVPEVDGKIAAIGYCAGGTLAFRLAAEGVVDAAVSYYGGGNQGAADRAKDVKVPILFHYAADDSHITPEAIDVVKKAFAGHENAAFHVHEGAGHGFNCWARGSYNQKVAAFARGQTLQFLSKSL